MGIDRPTGRITIEPAMTPDEQEARRKGFTAGFAVACSELSVSHGEVALAKFLLTDAGITIAALT